MELEAANLRMLQAVWQYDNGLPCGASANAAKYLAGEAGFTICETAVMTLGGYGYAKEYEMERFYREAKLYEVAGGATQIQRNIIARHMGIPAQ